MNEGRTAYFADDVVFVGEFDIRINFGFGSGKLSPESESPKHRLQGRSRIVAGSMTPPRSMRERFACELGRFRRRIAFNVINQWREKTRGKNGSRKGESEYLWNNLEEHVRIFPYLTYLVFVCSRREKGFLRKGLGGR